MEEQHSHKTLVTFAVIVVIAAILGAIYYYSKQESEPDTRNEGALSNEQVQAIIQQNADKEKAVPLTTAKTDAIIKKNSGDTPGSKPLTDEEIQRIIKANE